MATYHTVKQGECLSSIAKRYNFADYRNIYDHPQNAQFKRRRPNPNIIRPGDRVFIPDKQEKQESRGTAQRHRFQIRDPQVLLRLVVKFDDEEPIASEPYEVVVGGVTLEGTTDQQGRLEQQIKADAQQGRLRFPNLYLEWNLKLGHLDPIEENTGVQARLNNLGFWCGEVDGIVGPRTRAALKQFQMSRQLSVTGEIDAPTRDTLSQEHDGE